jgi:hypothetical protein
MILESSVLSRSGLAAAGSVVLAAIGFGRRYGIAATVKPQADVPASSNSILLSFRMGFGQQSAHARASLFSGWKNEAAG